MEESQRWKCIFPIYNSSAMPCYDLCLAWNWEYDRDFIRLLESACLQAGLTFFPVTNENLPSTLEGLSKQEISFKALLDRASESDACFQPLADWFIQHETLRINPQELSLWAVDKAAMQHEFVSCQLETPFTILIPPYNEKPNLDPPDLSPFEGRFAIKPSTLGGGEGVVLGACSMEQVLTSRQQHPGEKYLLQAQITPQMMAGRPAWFRVLVCDGAVFPCWWEPVSHVYHRVTAEERFHFGLRLLYEIPLRITQICHLDLFSTEIAVTPDGKFLVVDYVNDPVDLRLQSTAIDGVPDDVVAGIARRLARLVERKITAGK
jgi:hypothetical protein